MRIFRYGIPVDDRWHEMEAVMDPLSVGCRQVSAVEFWAWEPHDGPFPLRFFRVYGTGQEIPENVKYWGTVVAPNGCLVWHLVEATSDLEDL